MTARIAVIGFDPSPLRVGVCAIERNGQQVIMSRTLHVAEKDGGWLHEQVRDKVEDFILDLWAKDCGIVAWYREEPMCRSLALAQRFGYVCAAVDAIAIDKLSYADTITADKPGRASGIRPSEWRKAVGLPGNAKKTTCQAFAEQRAQLSFATDDEADAYLIAVAGEALLNSGEA